jgi:hypothetical protein
MTSNWNTTSTFWQIEDDLNFFKLEDELNFLEKWKKTSTFGEMEDNLNLKVIGRRPQF